MSAFDDAVQKIVDDTLGKTSVDPNDPCCGRTYAVFRELQRQRQVPGASLDMPLAAAEHYMFARFMVCAGQVSPFQMAALTRGYDLKKRLDSFFGSPNKEAVTNNPVSPPNKDVVAWGLKGVSEGSADHDRCNKDVKPKAWRSVEEIFGKGKGGPY